MLFFNSSIKTDSFKIVFNDIKDREYVYLRELGFWKDMEEEYQQEMKKYEGFKETTDFREYVMGI